MAVQAEQGVPDNASVGGNQRSARIQRLSGQAGMELSSQIMRFSWHRYRVVAIANKSALAMENIFGGKTTQIGFGGCLEEDIGGDGHGLGCAGAAAGAPEAHPVKPGDEFGWLITIFPSHQSPSVYAQPWRTLWSMVAP